ncbi:hypothetical protein GQ600_15983 [Phytophthora cactorum]|nr:hypothetical protein GQ600_15983 [Phytophthora cactorum]
MDDLVCVECLYANTEEDHRQNRFTCAFHEHQTINGESIGVWLSRAPLQSPVCLDAISTQDCLRDLTSMEQVRGITGRSTLTSALQLLPTEEDSFVRIKMRDAPDSSVANSCEVARAHSSTDAAGLLFEQIKSRLPFSSTSTKGRGRRLDQLSWRTLARELKPQNSCFLQCLQ